MARTTSARSGRSGAASARSRQCSRRCSPSWPRAGAGAQNPPEVSVSLVGGVWVSSDGSTESVPILEGNDIRFELARTGASTETLVDTVFDDAALASLSLSDPHGSGGVSLDPAFSSGHTEYEATFGRGVTVRVHAAVRDPGATFVIRPRFGQSDQSAGHDVLLTPGRATAITVTVTAENGTTQQTYTVQLVNAIVTLAVTPSRIGENRGSATVTATIDPPFSQEVYVTVQAAPVAPAASTDWIVSDRNWLYFHANATAGTGTVTITAVNDERLSPDKEVRVIGTTLAAGVPVVETTLTIEDDDRSATLALSPDPVAEDGGAQTVTVTAVLDAQASSHDTPIEVMVSVAGGTATEGTDFAAVADFPVEIPANARSGSDKFTLTPFDDGAFENDETVTVSGAATGLDVAAATLTLAEDDLPWVTMETAATSVAEDGSVTFTLTREGSLTAPLARSSPPRTRCRPRAAPLL